MTVPAKPESAPITSRERTRAIALRALREQGELVGAQRIRDEIGYGSLQTINEELRKVRKEWADRLERSFSLPELPAELALEATGFLQSLWERTLQHAHQAFDQERQGLANAEIAQQGQISSLQQLIASQQAENAALHAAADHSAALFHEQGQSLTLLRQELDHLRQQQEQDREDSRQAQQATEIACQQEIKQAVTKQRQAETQLSLLNDDLMATQKTHQKMVAQLKESQHKSLREHSLQLDLLRQKSNVQATGLAVATERLAIASDQIAQGTEQASNQQQKITDLEKLLNTKNDELATANQELTGLRAAYAESKQNMLDLLQRLPSAQK